MSFDAEYREHFESYWLVAVGIVEAAGCTWVDGAPRRAIETGKDHCSKQDRAQNPDQGLLLGGIFVPGF